MWRNQNKELLTVIYVAQTFPVLGIVFILKINLIKSKVHPVHAVSVWKAKYFARIPVMR